MVTARGGRLQGPASRQLPHHLPQVRWAAVGRGHQPGARGGPGHGKAALRLRERAFRIAGLLLGHRLLREDGDELTQGAHTEH